MTTTNRPVLTLGCDNYGHPIIPRKLLDLAFEREKEEGARVARAAARAAAREEVSRRKAELREARRQAAIRQQEWEDRRYARKIEELHRRWQAKLAEQERAAERERALRADELTRRQTIMAQSLRVIAAQRCVNLEDFETMLTPVHSGYYSTSQEMWLCSGRHRRKAALAMAEALGQLSHKRQYNSGRGPRPPHKQRRGWKAHLRSDWSRRDHVERKWQWCFE